MLVYNNNNNNNNNNKHLLINMHDMNKKLISAFQIFRHFGRFNNYSFKRARFGAQQIT